MFREAQLAQPRIELLTKIVHKLSHRESCHKFLCKSIIIIYCFMFLFLLATKQKTLETDKNPIHQPSMRAHEGTKTT